MITMFKPRTTEAVDDVEMLRRRGRLKEGLAGVERVLEQAPGHPRALLVKSRLLYEQGSAAQALEALRLLERVRDRRELEPLAAALGRLEQESARAPEFATESMAKLLIQQGYFLEALEVYRRLFESAPTPGERSELLQEIGRVQAMAERDGSRGAARERVERELGICARWLAERRGGA